jgi:hypothetical protein
VGKLEFVEPEFPRQQVIELACAAQRVNKSYIKTVEAVFSEGMKVMYYKHPNKTLMLSVLGHDTTKYSAEYSKPALLCTNLDDKELAENIQKFYKRLLFSAIEGDNEFQTQVNQLLNSETIPLNKFGFIACLPSVYNRDYSRNQFEKRIKTIDESYLASIGSNVEDLDCEVLSSQRSKNFDAWNIEAIIDNKMISWMSKMDLKLGPAVLIKAKVKDHSIHWKYEKPVTRLNYVKAAQ